MPPNNQAGGKSHSGRVGVPAGTVGPSWTVFGCLEKTSHAGSFLPASQHPVAVHMWCPRLFWAFPGASLFTSSQVLLHQCLEERMLEYLLLLLSLCFSSTLFFSAFGRLIILPRYNLKRRHPVVPLRDSRQWVVRIWSLTGNKVCLGFYLQSRSICNSAARVGFGHFVEAPMSWCSMPAQHSPACDTQVCHLQLAVCWDLPLPAAGWAQLRLPLTRGRKTWLELSSCCSPESNPTLLPSPFGNSAPKVKKQGV